MQQTAANLTMAANTRLLSLPSTLHLHLVQATVRQVNNSDAMIAAHQEENTNCGDPSTPLPLQQRQLFSSSKNGTRNNNSPSGTSQYLCRYHSALGQESLNMSDILEEQEEGGDSDSVKDTIKCDKLDQCLDESICDHLQFLARNEGPKVSDCDTNACLPIKKGSAIICLSLR